MRIAIAGDIGIDVNVSCVAKKIASEAPIPVFEELDTTYNLAMAANVAAMCVALGAEVLLCGVCGLDDDSEFFNEGDFQLAILEKEKARTTVKKRYFDVRDGQRHIVSRFDRDCDYRCSPVDSEWMISQIDQFNPDAVVVQDHGKGVVTQNLVDGVAARWETFIDPCRKTPYPNDQTCIVGSDDEISTNNEIRTRNDMIFKMGAGGMGFYPALSNQFEFLIPAFCKNPVNTVGAGDQFLAALVTARLEGMNWKDACHVASVAAAIQVSRAGMKPVTPTEIYTYNRID